MEEKKMPALVLFLVIAGFLGGIAFLSGCAKKNVIPEKPWIIIDVRTPEEFSTAHVKGALNIPYDSIGAKIAANVPSKESSVLLYCRSGRRSGIAFETLKGLGYKDVTNAGGYEGLSKRFGVE